MNAAWFTPALAYLLGSIPFGFLLVKIIHRRDIRATGSGNIGAANVMRTVGSGAGLATLLLDAAKGYLAVWLAGRLTEGSATWMTVAALAAIIGHLFPVWLGFKGGRGVATGVGAFVPVCWEAVLGALAVWVLAVIVWRYVSLGSILAAASLPPLVYLLYAPPYRPPLVVSAGTALAAAMIILKHRANIERLIAGTEPRLKLRK